MALRGIPKETWLDETLPPPALRPTLRNSFRQRRNISRLLLALTVSAGLSLALLWVYPSLFHRRQIQPTVRVIELPATSRAVSRTSEPVDFNALFSNASVPRVREESARYEPGTPATLIRNARIWTGTTEKGLLGDIFVDRGLIRAVGVVDEKLLRVTEHVVVNAHEHWVTPGIVDLFWRTMTEEDENGEMMLIGPPQEMPFYFGWHRWSEIERSVKAGTTVALAFPGSTLERTTHNVPGILLKLRDMPNAVRTPPQSAMLIEPPVVDEGGYPHITQTWQHWKYAVGPIRRSPWKLPYDSMPGPTHTLSRQGSKLFAECYTVSDVQEVVRISAAHKLEIDMIDYMGSDYWGSDVWPKTGGQPPVIAITNAFENLSGEQKVAGLVAQAVAEGLRVLIKPAMASRTHRSRRNVMDEARSAFAHGLYNTTEALASVTSVPADIAGYGDRIGQVREGFDADLILWSMHPLRYEAPYVATPVQVWIDGIAQVPGKVPFLETDQEWLLPPRPLSKHRRQAGR